jgi:hypothetical protein
MHSFYWAKNAWNEFRRSSPPTVLPASQSTLRRRLSDRRSTRRNAVKRNFIDSIQVRN